MVSPEFQTEAEKRFVAYHERLRAELNAGYWHFRVYTAVEAAMDEYLREMNQASGFFQMTLLAHRRQALMQLAKLLDNGAASVGVLQLLRHCERNPGMFRPEEVRRRVKGHKHAHEIAEAHEGVDENTVVGWVQEDRKKLWALPTEKVATLRNKALAHIDRKTVEHGEVSTPYPFRPEIEACFETLHGILNRYSWQFSSERWTMELQAGRFEREMATLLGAVRFRREAEGPESP